MVTKLADDPPASAGRTSPTPLPDADRAQVIATVVDWFAEHRRDLPWRRPETGAWGVLVSEFMLQQTPVSRVIQPWHEWLRRWPTPADLAGEPSGAAVAAWGRLGYPRRAQRLHAAAVAITEEHDGVVPSTLTELQALPGVGRYTAAAVVSFAFAGSAAVLDTNVRRVLARLEDGVEFPPDAATSAEWRRAEEWVSAAGEATAAKWAAASMELGALTCKAINPSCETCPVANQCRWLAADKPRYTGPRRRAQAWNGTDRQCRGALLDVVRARNAEGRPVEIEIVLNRWPDRSQAERCLEGLLTDHLVQRSGELLSL